jgi:nicotinate-nucleotide pyrophosphorylase (carboxylating)
VSDGEAFAAGDVLASVTGPARGVLTAERVGLNFTQRMSGIATLTAAYVAAVAGTGARIADTRKTTPGLRRFERHAVRSGGGHNHRFSLSDAVMAKDNHLAFSSPGTGRSPPRCRRPARRCPTRRTSRSRSTASISSTRCSLPAPPRGVGTIMLDNFTLEDLRAASPRSPDARS